MDGPLLNQALHRERAGQGHAINGMPGFWATALAVCLVVGVIALGLDRRPA